MPELPEVETTLRGIEPHILNLPIERISIRESKLRWKVPKKDLEKNLNKKFHLYLFLKILKNNKKIKGSNHDNMGR